MRSIVAPGAPHVQAAVASAAARTGVSFGYLFNQARIESCLDPAAKASTSSAAGLFQFTQQTWLRMLKTHGADHGLDWAARAISETTDGQHHISDGQLKDAILDLRFDAVAASNMAAALAIDNRTHLETNLGRSAEPVDLYLAHFLGAQGAVRFLRAYDKDAGQNAALLFPEAAAANKSIFYADNGMPKSLGAIRSRFSEKLGQMPPSSSVHYRLSSSVPNVPTERRLRLSAFEPMPGRLSIGFAQSAYQRLSAISGAS